MAKTDITLITVGSMKNGLLPQNVALAEAHEHQLEHVLDKHCQCWRSFYVVSGAEVTTGPPFAMG